MKRSVAYTCLSECHIAGDPVTFTPLIGLSALEKFASTQLANFKELEAAYSSYWRASTSATDKTMELKNTIRKNTQNIDTLVNKQADVLSQRNASLAEFTILAAKRSAANITLNNASQAFKEAVNRARANKPSFLELLGIITSTVVNVGADVAGIGKITGKYRLLACMQIYSSGHTITCIQYLDESCLVCFDHHRPTVQCCRHRAVTVLCLHHWFL